MDGVGVEYSFGAENGICVIWGDYGIYEMAVGIDGGGFYGKTPDGIRVRKWRM